MATSFTTHSAGQVIASADINLIQTAVNTLENAGGSTYTGGPLPANMVVPVKAWMCDPINLTTTTTPNSGVLQLTAVYVPAAITVNTIYTAVNSTGTATHGFAGLWTFAVGGARLGISSDITTAAASTVGLVTYTLTGSVNLSPGWVYVGFWIVASVAPVMLGNAPAGGGNGMNILTPSPTRRSATADTGLVTTSPATLGTMSGSNNMFWVAVA